MIARLGPPLTILLLAGPVLAGLAGTLLPAFGYLPALGGDTLSIAPFAELAAKPGIWRSAWVSYYSGLAAAAVSLLLVLLFVAAWAGTRAFTTIQHLVSPLLSVPHAAAAFGFAFLIAPSGVLARLTSPWLTGWERPPDVIIVNDGMALSLIAGLVVKEVPFLLLVTLAALPQVPVERTRKITALLGYGRIAGFIYASWPQIYRQIRLAVLAVIAFSASVVDVAAILGPTLPGTLAVRLAGWMNDPEISMRFLASAGAVLQLGVAAAAILTWIALEKTVGPLVQMMARAGYSLRRDRWLRLAVLWLMAVAAGIVFAGLAALAIWSLAGLWQFPSALPDTLTLKNWMRAAPRIAGPLVTTFIVAACATAIAVALAMMCLVREVSTGKRATRFALPLIYLPLVVPQVAFLFGLQLLFVLSGTVASLPALILAHLVFVLPYVFLSLSDPWRAFDTRYEAIAAGLGKSRTATLWRVRAPMLLRAILTAAAVGFAVSIGQYLPTLLVGAGRLPTVTTEAVALASGGNRRVIGVYAFAQMLLPLAGFAVATLVPALLFRRFRAMRA
ncbi:MAG: ABC transporter permease subunit [Brucellaceae bacterium]|nr:ABC transporter permease subunit [Brucellaceae bacterium]